MSCFSQDSPVFVTASSPVDQNVSVLPILSEDIFVLKITMILRQKVGNLRLISSEDLFFSIENTDKFLLTSVPVCHFVNMVSLTIIIFKRLTLL